MLSLTMRDSQFHSELLSVRAYPFCFIANLNCVVKEKAPPNKRYRVLKSFSSYNFEGQNGDMVVSDF